MIKFIKNFKSYSTKLIKQMLRSDNRYYLTYLVRQAELNRKREKFSIWNYKNWPVLVESDCFFEQKLNYIHYNPVAKGYVEEPSDWKYSSARNYEKDDHSIIEIDTDGELD